MNKRIAGLRAKRNGDRFESLLEFYARSSGFNIIRIPNGAKSIGNNQIIREKSPFDYVAVSPCLNVFFDAKTINEKRFSYSKIKQHQLIALKKATINPNNLVDYIISFDSNVGFCPLERLLNMKPRESITIDDCAYLGSLSTGIDFKRLTLTPSVSISTE